MIFIFDEDLSAQHAPSVKFRTSNPDAAPTPLAWHRFCLQFAARLESIQFAMYTQFAVSLLAFAYFYFTPGYHLLNTFVPILGMGLGSFIIAYLLRYYYSAHFHADLN